MTAPSALQDRIHKEVESTLKLLDDTRQRARREEVPWSLWLRAARGCWLIGNTDWAKDFYRRAANGLVEHANTVGRRSGMYEEYGSLAMGAAWMTERQEFAADICRQIDQMADQQIKSLENQPEPLIRVMLLLTRLRAAWYRNLTPTIKELVPEIDRRVNQLEAWSKTFWQAERASASHGFFKALLTAKPDPVKLAIMELDKRLEELRAQPPNVSDLTDEEMISFAASLATTGTQLPPIRTPVSAGGIR